MGIFGFVVVLVVVILGALVGGRVNYFLDNPSFVFLLGFLVGCLLISRTSIRLLWRSLYPGKLSENELREAIRGWRSTRAFAMSGGCLGTLIGLVTMLHFLDNPDFGLGLATAMVPIFYGALLSYAVALPVQYRLEGELSNGSRKAASSNLFSALIFVGVASVIWAVQNVIYHYVYPVNYP